MSTHFAVLPQGVIDSLSVQFQADIQQSNANALAADLPFLRLLHPRTGIPSFFLPYHASENTYPILEVQEISPPNSRSWFVGEEVVSDGRMLIMTPIDPAFLLIPLMQAVQPTDGTEGIFRPADDIFYDIAAALSAPNDVALRIDPADIHRFASLSCISGALTRLCEVKDISPDIKVYRFSQRNLLTFLCSKVALIEQHAAFNASRSVTRDLARDGLMEDGMESLLTLGRRKAACKVIGQYTPASVQAALLATYDFGALETHLNSLMDETAIASAVAASGNGAKKKKSKEDKDKNEGLKRKKSNASVAVEKLKKVNTNGMKKLSSFFVANA